MECLICCDSISSSNVRRCNKKGCKSIMCRECFIELLRISNENGVIPRCPDPNCGTYYVYSQISELGPEATAAYCQACLQTFVVKVGDDAKKKIEYQRILDGLRQERRKFIREKLPAAIVLVAEISMGNKLRRIEKQKAESISKKVGSARRNCMNLFCDGLLDEEMTCMKCGTSFCKDCEKRLGTNHKCKAEDIESINFIQTLVHCPNCGLAIQKSEGCNGMTCAHCKTTFDYGTGETTNHGSHNAEVTIVKKRRLSVMYEKVLSSGQITKLAQIEDLAPTPASLASIHTLLEKYYKKVLDEKPCARRIAKEFEVYTKRQALQRVYQNYLNEIEEKLALGELRTAHLRTVLEKINA